MHTKKITGKSTMVLLVIGVALGFISVGWSGSSSATTEDAAMEPGKNPCIAEIPNTPKTKKGKKDKPQRKPRLKVGDVPPPFQSKEWLGAEIPPTWKSLKGKVVLIDFWATWCEPCVEGIPEINELQEKYRDQGLVVLGITWEQADVVREFIKEIEMKYPVGCGGTLAKDLRVRGFPSLFLFGRDGKFLWKGNPAYGEQEVKIVEALKIPVKATP
ncbi:TlpA disulfide reductase family protein [Pontiella sulfatireligans]|uniref:Thiol-disulfide oxidoreductase ResA n=1 Tax=Pontiella sulfatireligans TaxID=2750658 RepID=A0A6C2UD23_9BACT|nr:TlpA disulfide reductase family protein [Pontiella sulfatireligans]VGO18088.1 Thiol-disulfide oxidoreductase ResA [Pontiella sulfatireligans]